MVQKTKMRKNKKKKVLKNIYELMNETGFKYEELTGMLLKLQLMGLVEQPSENYYSKA